MGKRHKAPKEEPIGPEEDLVNPFRLAKGDLSIKKNLKGKISYAGVVDKSIAKILLRNGVLQQHHEVYGLGFLELRNAFRHPWMPRSCAVMLEQWGIGASVGNATEIYQNVCRGMRGRGLEVVQYVMENEEDVAGRRLWAEKYSNGLYQEHFDRLVELMDAERERIFKEQQKNVS